jgi:hypothetical protein
MSMGYGAAYADVITKKRIKRTCPTELAAFLRVIKDAGSSLENVAQHLAQDTELDLSHIEDDKEAVKKQEAIHKTWRKLQRVFKRVSEGLALDIGYHNSEDEGSRYDEVDGAFFCVGGVYRLTPAGKRFRRSIKRRFFVTFG